MHLCNMFMPTNPKAWCHVVSNETDGVQDKRYHRHSFVTWSIKNKQFWMRHRRTTEKVFRTVFEPSEFDHGNRERAKTRAVLDPPGCLLCVVMCTLHIQVVYSIHVRSWDKLNVRTETRGRERRELCLPSFPFLPPSFVCPGLSSLSPPFLPFCYFLSLLLPSTSPSFVPILFMQIMGQSESRRWCWHLDLI